jgi:hypothetical protein
MRLKGWWDATASNKNQLKVREIPVAVTVLGGKVDFTPISPRHVTWRIVAIPKFRPAKPNREQEATSLAAKA